MNKKEMFIWLVYAGLGTQIATSITVIDCMTIALQMPDDLLPDDVEKIAVMAKELIGWRFLEKARPGWVCHIL